MKDTVDPGNPALQREGRARQADVAGGRRDRASGARACRGRPARTTTTRWPATPATPRGPRAAAAATCRSRPTGRPSATTTRAARRATSRPTIRRSRATTCSSSGMHGTVKGNSIAPVRSSSALVLSLDQHQPRAHLHPAAADLRERLLQPGLRAALSAHRAQDRDQDLHRLPRLGRPTTTTRSWRSCCCSGPTSSTSSASTPGSARSGGVEAVRVTEWDEPQAVIGSYLQRYAYPDWYAAHLDARRASCEEAHEPSAGGRSRLPAAARRVSLRRRGRGRHARLRRRHIANKGVSERIITAPFSPLGQRHPHRARRNATCVALPTNQPIAPARNQGKLMREDNQEQPFTRSTTTPSSPMRRRA